MDALSQIEKTHIDFFKKRPARNEYGEHDRLHNHYGMINQYGRLTFGIMGDSELPEEIKNECIDTFNLIWHESK